MSHRFLSHTPLEAGQREKLIRIERLIEDRGASSYPIERWVTLAQMWTMKLDWSARERQAMDSTSATVDTVWRLPYRVDMDPELVDVAKVRRLVYKGRVYDIVAATLIGRYEGIELETLAKVG